MVQADFGPGADFPKRLSNMEKAIAALGTRDVLQNASIGNGGITVDGGEIHVTNGGSIVVDGSGTITLPTGAFSSGSVTTNSLTVNGNASVTGTATVGALSSSGAASVASVSATGNVSASGQVISTGVVKSPGSYAYAVSTGYVACWINNDGSFGYSSSTRATKKDLQALSGRSELSQKVTPYLGRYVSDAETDPLKVFLLAEDVQAAGYGPDVAPLDAEGNLFTLNYSQIVVPLLQDIRQAYAEIDALKARLAAAGIA